MFVIFSFCLNRTYPFYTTRISEESIISLNAVYDIRHRRWWCSLMRFKESSWS